MSLRRKFGIALIFTIFMASLNINQVKGGHKEMLAKKLIKLFLASAMFSPQKMGPSIKKTMIEKKDEIN
jgi:hypothetical protein